MSVGVCAGDISACVTDEASSDMTATTASSETGTDSADTTSVSGIVELWAELPVVERASEASSPTSGTGFGTVAAYQQVDKDLNQDLHS